MMLSRALEYQSALDLFGPKEHDYTLRLSQNDCLMVEKMCTFLKNFYQIHKSFL